MTTTMKGLLKGLRYISEIFDNEKEPEMEIGLPTDVKHVAHIGWDGPSTTAPSWMSEFPASSEASEGSPNLNVDGMVPAIKTSGQGEDPLSSGIAPMDSPTKRGKTKQSKRQTASSSVGSPARELKPRRNKNSNGDSPTKEASRARRIKNSILGSDSPSQDQAPKKNRKKKGSGDGSTRPSRTKNRDQITTDNTCPDPGDSNDMCLKPGRGCEE